MPSSRPTPTPAPLLHFYLRSNFRMWTPAAIAGFFLLYHPVIHTDEDSAIDEARHASPVEESPEERELDLIELTGGVLETGPEDEFAQHTGYLAELQLRDLRIEATPETRKAAHLEYADHKDPPDALWLPPQPEYPTGQRLRIIARKSLANRILVIRTAAIPSRLLAPPR